MQMPSDFENKLEMMSNTFVSSEEKDNHEFLGQLIDKSLLYEYKTAGGKVKLSSAEVIKAFESIYHDTSSKYYLSNQECSIVHYYDALSAQVTNGKDIINRFEKTILISMLFNLTNKDDAS